MEGGRRDFMKNMCKGCMYNKDEYKEYRIDSDETDYYVCTKAEICGGGSDIWCDNYKLEKRDSSITQVKNIH